MSNDWVFRIEEKLRRSWFAKLLPLIRERFPAFHGLMVEIRDRLLPYDHSEAINRYQYRAIHRFIKLAQEYNATNVVLEVGSDLEGAVARELRKRGFGIVVGINPQLGIDRSALPDNSATMVYLLRADARRLPLAGGSVSSIISIATFEHINNLKLALDECHRVLRAGGILYSNFGPIWSSSVGHHVYARVGDEEVRHWKPGKNPIPNYGHLLYSKEELRKKLQKGRSPGLVEAMLEWIYDKDDINRLFFEDYILAFRQSRFRVARLNKTIEFVDRAILKRLQYRHPHYKEFGCRIIEVVLEKD